MCFLQLTVSSTTQVPNKFHSRL